MIYHSEIKLKKMKNFISGRRKCKKEFCKPHLLFFQKTLKNKNLRIIFQLSQNLLAVFILRRIIHLSVGAWASICSLSGYAS